MVAVGHRGEDGVAPGRDERAGLHDVEAVRRLARPDRHGALGNVGQHGGRAGKLVEGARHWSRRTRQAASSRAPAELGTSCLRLAVHPVEPRQPGQAGERDAQANDRTARRRGRRWIPIGISAEPIRTASRHRASKAPRPVRAGWWAGPAAARRWRARRPRRVPAPRCTAGRTDDRLVHEGDASVGSSIRPRRAGRPARGAASLQPGHHAGGGDAADTEPGEQVAVALGAGAEHLIGEDDEQHGVGAVTRVTTRQKATTWPAVGEVPIARIPTSICSSGPTCPPSVTSTGLLRVRIVLTRRRDHERRGVRRGPRSTVGDDHQHGTEPGRPRLPRCRWCHEGVGRAQVALGHEPRRQRGRRRSVCRDDRRADCREEQDSAGRRQRHRDRHPRHGRHRSGRSRTSRGPAQALGDPPP